MIGGWLGAPQSIHENKEEQSSTENNNDSSKADIL